MQRLLSLWLTLALAGASCAARAGEPFSILGPSCESRGPQAGATRPKCTNPNCTRCRQQNCAKVPEGSCEKKPQRGAPPPGEEAPYGGGYQETGAYVAPPRTGSMRGATTYRGVDGGTLTFPEIRLRFPCIELPACFHSRSSAHMKIDSAVAPWESHGYAQTGGGSDAALRQRIADLENELQKSQAAPRGASEGSDQAAKAREAAEDYAKKLQEYEDLLKRCEEEQQRLRECIQKCLEQHQGHEGGQRSIQKSPRQSPEQAPLGPPPVPSESQLRKLPPPAFPAAPASFLTEPVRRESPRISEPRAPAARITGVRPIR